jgi:hypothetical protein
MKNFLLALKEIDKTLGFLISVENILNTILLFLGVYLLLSIVNLYPILAVLPALVYFIIKARISLKEDKRVIVEGKYMSLREKLRTAADNVEKENPVVDELEEEVIEDLKNVNLSSFVKTKGLTYRIFGAILLSFAIVFITTSNLYIVDLNKFLGLLPDAIDGLTKKISDNKELTELNESQGIYGQSSLATLGDDQIDIKISPANYEVNVRGEGDVEQRQFDEVFPTEVNIGQSSASEEKIPEEQQELVKSYFNKLANR